MSDYTVKQVAARYGKTTRTVRNWMSLYKKEMGHELGVVVKSARRFTLEECEILRSYGVKPGCEIQGELVEDFTPGFTPSPSEVTDLVPQESEGQALLNFTFSSVQVRTRNEDLTQLEDQTDLFEDISKAAFKAAGQYLSNDLIGSLKLAAAQNRNAIAGLQAKAATDAIKSLEDL